MPIQPIYLLSDSQLLFWPPFLQQVLSPLSSPSPKAVYLGASNGDQPEYYSIFEGAMNAVGVQDCHHSFSSFSKQDRQAVEQADLILLAGGSVELGWNTFQRVGLDQLLRQRYHEGAILIGISAGAVHLGAFGWEDNHEQNLFETLQLVPWIIGPHEEANQWKGLKEQVKIKKGEVKGLGIPFGAGLLYTPDHPPKAIRHPVVQISFQQGRIVEKQLTLSSSSEIQV